MDYMGFIRNGYHQPNYHHMQAFNGQHQSHQGHQGYTYNLTYEQQQLVYAQLQQQRAAVMMTQNTAPQAKPTESKPRLAKDEVETLEREFQKNPKPNSSLKRELADQMRVDVARINNWFQNRRAKAKQIKRTQEFEAQNATERAPSESRSPEDQGEGSVSEFYGMSNHSQPLQASSASFDNTSSDQQPQSFLSRHDEESPASAMSSLDPVAESVDDEEADAFSQEEYPSPNSLHFQQSNSSSSVFHPAVSSFIPAHPANEFHMMPSYPSTEVAEQSHQDGQSISSPDTYNASSGHAPSMRVFEQFNGTPAIDDGSMSSFPSQFAPEDIETSSFKSEGHENEVTSPTAPVKLEHLSPSSFTQSSPISSDLRFKSPPPPADIATRRKMARPAQLNPNAFRSYSYGPRTALEPPRRSEAASPMRRIASATGTMPPRVQKLTLGSAPRSPMFTERNKEAFLQSLQGALSPVTPNDNMHSNHQGMRETTVSSNSSDEESRYTFGTGQNPYFQMSSVSSSIKTPPGTPGIRSQFPVNNLEAAWNFMPSDEPLVTPGLGSFGSDLDFPAASAAPGYAASQPTTPSFPSSIGPTYYPIFNGNSSANLEYKFPDSYNPESSARSSPLQAHSRSFQFTQNITPQDFSHER